jgi:peptidoglycan/LPS O-acetylase OafA/YrhL
MSSGITPASLASDAPGSAPGRLLQLEGLRGLTAVMVVAWHFVWAFSPAALGSVAGMPASGLIGSPLLAVIDGPAAVCLFFVLSGFVLPLGLFRAGRSRVAVQAAAKRWLRLAGLSVLAVLLSYALFRLGLFHYREAARLTHSAWLGSYGGGDPGHTLSPSLFGALREGLVGAFVQNADTYDPVLWTMRHELFGSFVSIGVGLAVWRASASAGLGILLAAVLLSAAADPWLIAFVAGTGLAWLVWRRGVRLRGPVAAASIAAGLFLFGYLEPHGVYRAIPVLQDSAGFRYDRIVLHTVSAVLIMLGLIGNDTAGRLFKTTPLLWLGRLSFAVYLFHFPLLCSLACGLFVSAHRHLSYAGSLAVAAALYVPVVLLAGMVFTRVDEAWGTWVNRLTNALLRHAESLWQTLSLAGGSRPPRLSPSYAVRRLPPDRRRADRP